MAAASMLIALMLAACGSDDAGEAGSSEGGDDFPSREVRVIIPSEPGGTLDLQFRSVQKFWERELGQSLVPDYRDGAAGNIGRNALVQAPGDGYTIGVDTLEQVVFAVDAEGAEYELDDFTWVARQVFQPVSIIVRKESDYATFEDLIEDARRRPGKVRIGMSNVASDKGLTLLLLEQATGAKFRLVPFDSGSAARTALLAGDVEAAGTNVFTALELGDDIRTLAVHAPENEFADITDDAPTIAGAVGDIGMETSGGSGVYSAPAGLARDHPERLEVLASTLQRALENPEFLESLDERRAEVNYLGPADLSDYFTQLRDGVERYASLFEPYQGGGS